MKNVYVQEVSYENFAGEEKTQKLHFHMTPREFADWMLDNMAEALRIQRVFTELQKLDATEQASPSTLKEVMGMVRLFAELSYGTPSADGEYFSRPKEGYKFSESAAYDAFRMDLFEHPDKIEKFVNTVMNPEVVEEFAKRLPTNVSAIDESFDDLTEEEFQALTTEQKLDRYKKMLEAKGGHKQKQTK